MFFTSGCSQVDYVFCTNSLQQGNPHPRNIHEFTNSHPSNIHEQETNIKMFKVLATHDKLHPSSVEDQRRARVEQAE